MRYETYSQNLSSEDLSSNGIPDRNKMIVVVNKGDATANHSKPSKTLHDIIKIPHHKTISPK